MGLAQTFEKEKLICGCLVTDLSQLPTIQAELEQRWGPVDFVSDTYSFSEISPYYDEEMDGSVTRVFYSFRDLIDPSELAAIKTETNRIEAQYAAADGSRRINLDPGTMGPGKLILATTKPAAHRIALSDGIFAEITLFYARGNFQNLPWTYIDFRQEKIKTILRAIRKNFMNQRKQNSVKESSK